MVETLVIIGAALLIAGAIATRWRHNRARRSPAAGIHEVPDNGRDGAGRS